MVVGCVAMTLGGDFGAWMAFGGFAALAVLNLVRMSGRAFKYDGVADRDRADN